MSALFGVEMERIMEWQNTYPDMATAMAASFETLGTWRDNLPQPQTDVERTVLRRITKRWEELGRDKVREQAPHIADKLNDLASHMERLGMGRPFPKM